MASLTVIEFRVIPSLEGYMADSFGRIWTRRGIRKGRNKDSDLFKNEWRELGFWVGKRGYAITSIRNLGVTKERYVHQLVAEAFHGPNPDKLDVCHNDGNPTNNAPDNLRYDTRRNNQMDRLVHGTSNRGSQNGMAKLNEQQASEIKALIRRGERTGVIAKRYGVSGSTISDIKYGRQWACVS